MEGVVDGTAAASVRMPLCACASACECVSAVAAASSDTRAPGGGGAAGEAVSSLGALERRGVRRSLPAVESAEQAGGVRRPRVRRVRALVPVALPSPPTLLPAPDYAGEVADVMYPRPLPAEAYERVANVLRSQAQVLRERMRVDGGVTCVALLACSEWLLCESVHAYSYHAEAEWGGPQWQFLRESFAVVHSELMDALAAPIWSLRGLANGPSLSQFAFRTVSASVCGREAECGEHPPYRHLEGIPPRPLFCQPVVHDPADLSVCDRGSASVSDVTLMRWIMVMCAAVRRAAWELPEVSLSPTYSYESAYSREEKPSVAKLLFNRVVKAREGIASAVADRVGHAANAAAARMDSCDGGPWMEFARVRARIEALRLLYGVFADAKVRGRMIDVLGDTWPSNLAGRPRKRHVLATLDLSCVWAALHDVQWNVPCVSLGLRFHDSPLAMSAAASEALQCMRLAEVAPDVHSIQRLQLACLRACATHDAELVADDNNVRLVCRALGACASFTDVGATDSERAAVVVGARNFLETGRVGECWVVLRSFETLQSEVVSERRDMFVLAVVVSACVADERVLVPLTRCACADSGNVSSLLGELRWKDARAAFERIRQILRQRRCCAHGTAASLVAANYAVRATGGVSVGRAPSSHGGVCRVVRDSAGEQEYVVVPLQRTVGSLSVGVVRDAVFVVAPCALFSVGWDGSASSRSDLECQLVLARHHVVMPRRNITNREMVLRGDCSCERRRLASGARHRDVEAGDQQHAAVCAHIAAVRAAVPTDVAAGVLEERATAEIDRSAVCRWPGRMPVQLCQPDCRCAFRGAALSSVRLALVHESVLCARANVTSSSDKREIVTSVQHVSVAALRSLGDGAGVDAEMHCALHAESHEAIGVGGERWTSAERERCLSSRMHSEDLAAAFAVAVAAHSAQVRRENATDDGVVASKVSAAARLSVSVRAGLDKCLLGLQVRARWCRT